MVNISLESFQAQFESYKSAISEAKEKKASHDYLRQIFIEFLRKGFNIDPVEVELEKGIKGAKLRGSIDALYQDIVFEFKRNLKLEKEKGIEELKFYLRSLSSKQTLFGILTDGLIFEVYIFQDGLLRFLDEANLEKLSTDDAFLWFDAFLFSEKELVPTSKDVVKRFGDISAVFNSSFHNFFQMWAKVQEDPSCQVKFHEWDKLLAKAYGHSVARKDLFLRHTYLSLLVKLLAYTTLFKEKPKGKELPEIITGRAFVNLPNLAEEDFFCWVLNSSLQTETIELLRGLAQYLTVYDLTKIDEDFLKELYENLVDKETKHDLGEVYTPDWLVELTLREAGFSKGKRLLDPACGSGTFLFTAIRLLREAGLKGATLIDESLANIVGVDVHPLAVTIAKVNYILALASDLKDYGKMIILPVYMADSLQAGGTTGGELVSITIDGKEYFNIPSTMAQKPGSLNQIIDEMRKFADSPENTAMEGFLAFLKSEGFNEWAYVWRPNLRLMRKLIKEGRDTIWAFILKNYYRPAYLRHHPFDIVAGNPPWLSYRYITDPAYQEQVKRLTLSYGLLSKKDVNLFTHMEEATLFFTLSADFYLKKKGTIAFVMPRSVLTGAKQHHRFQEFLQSYHIPSIALEKVLDTEEVSPLFNVPACVLIATKEGKVEKIERTIIKGILPFKNVRWSEAKTKMKFSHKKMQPDKLFPPMITPSPYLKNIKAGANIYPRCLWFVQPRFSPFGINLERPAVETNPEAQRTAKKPWQNIHLQGEVEKRYLYATILGRQLLPFGFTDLSLVVLPLEPSNSGIRLIKKEEAMVRGHTGLHDWLSQVEALWKERKKANVKEDIYEWLNYRNKLTSQHLFNYYTILYNRVGTNLASSIMDPESINITRLNIMGFVVDIDTFFYQTKNENEAHYLCALLNSDYIDKAIKPYQTRGAWGERDITRRPFEYVPIPKFNSKDKRHLSLAKISKKCHKKLAELPLKGKSIGILRNRVREHLIQELNEIDKLVKEILTELP